MNEITEDNCIEYSICRLCKKIVHDSENPVKGNIEELKFGEYSTYSIIVECQECAIKRSEILIKKSRIMRILMMKRYLEKNI